ncbi:MAG: glycosyltransferase [Bacteroidales bacterium]|nr:glycosyltransferase [Bacteroidales bacterium]
MKRSIIIPVYHVEAYVGRMLEPVFATGASADDFEVIVVNDGTEDALWREYRKGAEHVKTTKTYRVGVAVLTPLKWICRLWKKA